jgi:hypothetical protein
MMSWIRFGLYTSIVIFAAGGCSSRTYPVQGKVVWSDGTPAAELAQGQIVFESNALKTSARGEIKPDGSFVLSTYSNDDGVPPGEYQIIVLEHRIAAEGKAAPPPHLDPKYTSASTSGITATVVAGNNPITITLERLKNGKP